MQSKPRNLETQKPFSQFLQPVSWDDAPCPVEASLQKTHALFRVFPPDGKSLFTGYFEPVLKGSRTRDARFKHPVYKAPDDLVCVRNFEGSNQPGARAYGHIVPAVIPGVAQRRPGTHHHPYPFTAPAGDGSRVSQGLARDDGERIPSGEKLIPHFTREEIESGALAGKNLELLFVEDEIELFFLHIQGSGKIILEDGSEIRLRFAGKNGHPYTAIGGVLKREENLQNITMQTIKNFLRTNPEKTRAILNRNASYIFFETLTGDGPISASGAVLKAGQSLAIDDTIWPYGLNVIVETRDPLNPEKPLILRMRTEDCGSAIRGVARGDIFFGAGEDAARKAGAMNAPGCLWIILER